MLIRTWLAAACAHLNRDHPNLTTLLMVAGQGQPTPGQFHQPTPTGVLFNLSSFLTTLQAPVP